MRTPSFAVLVALSLTLVFRSAQADTFQLPCDPEVAVSVGAGIFKGKTRAASVGQVYFERLPLGMPRVEVTLFDNCGTTDEDTPKVTRWYIGRLNVFGAVTPELTYLKIRNESGSSAGAASRSGNTLTKADLDGGTALTYNVGARASIVDADHFHVEAFIEHGGTLDWNEAEADTVVANVNRTGVDVTYLVQEHAQVMYRYSLTSFGLTIGTPLRSATTPHLRVTPFATIGRMYFSADVKPHVDPDFAAILAGVGVNPDDIAALRSIQKSSWSGLGGARLDRDRNLSVEASFAYGPGDSTRIYVGQVTITGRFDVSHLLQRLIDRPVQVQNLPF